MYMLHVHVHVGPSVHCFDMYVGRARASDSNPPLWDAKGSDYGPGLVNDEGPPMRACRATMSFPMSIGDIPEQIHR